MDKDKSQPVSMKHGVSSPAAAGQHLVFKGSFPGADQEQKELQQCMCCRKSQFLQQNPPKGAACCPARPQCQPRLCRMLPRASPGCCVQMSKSGFVLQGFQCSLEGRSPSAPLACWDLAWAGRALRSQQ